MGTPGSQINDAEKKFREMETKIKEFEPIINEYMTEMGPRKDTWNRSETDGPDKEDGKAKWLEKEN